ncbi:MAG: EAL domain-containing protein [Rhizobiaceae bacterium]
MRIRTFLVAAFLIATLTPAAIFGWLSYQTNATREFDQVSERHLLHAKNAGMALDRYYKDVVATFVSISDSLILGHPTPNLEALMKSIDMACVLIVDTQSGLVKARTDVDPNGIRNVVPPAFLKIARQMAGNEETQISNVLPSKRYGNVLLGVRNFGDTLAIAVIKTDYFGQLASSISFGEKGHAAIVDKAGNILAHPNAEWVESRKNISGVSAVARMMRGETGIERFYSPAIEQDMIAGLTSVAPAGWGVMIPQPVQELYNKAYQDTKTVFVVIAIGLILTFGFVIVLLDSLAFPIERLLASLRKNTEQKSLTKSMAKGGFVPLQEISQLNNSYDLMVEKVSDANAKISSLAFHDLVTGLPNRAKLREYSKRVIDENVDASSGTLVMVDLDNFKQINDVYGHAIGDAFLKVCSVKLARVVNDQWNRQPTGASGEQPIVARVGGDEFSIVFPGLINSKNIEVFLSRLQTELQTPDQSLNYIARWGASLGCARYPDDADNMADLAKLADLAMYQAKFDGKNRYQIYNKEIGTKTASELIVEVEQAIQNNELELEYQPKVDSKGENCVGVEALVRWNHPIKGRCPPNEWVPVIANSSVIEQLGEWTIQRAMDDQLSWQSDGLDINVAVNIGSRHFSNPNFVNRLRRLAHLKGFEPAKLEIEVTEDALFQTPQDAVIALQKLADAGFKVAIDDFGSGYSNFTRLSELKVNTLKIDRSIIFSSRHNERVQSMLECIIVMSKTLGCRTVAEGLETIEDVERMTALGIDLFQGFFYAGSMTAENLPGWIQSYSPESSRVLEDASSEKRRAVA